MDVDDIFKSDLTHVRKLLIESEQIGEKRVNFLLSFATAVGGGLVTLHTSDAAKHDAAWVHEVTVASLAALLLVSLVIYLRLLRRNRLTDHYGEVADMIVERRVRFSGQDGAIKFSYKPRWAPKEGLARQLTRGGFAQTVAVIMGILTAMLAILGLGLSYQCSIALGLLVLIVFSVIQLIDRKIRNKGPSHA